MKKINIYLMLFTLASITSIISASDKFTPMPLKFSPPSQKTLQRLVKQGSDQDYEKLNRICFMATLAQDTPWVNICCQLGADPKAEEYYGLTALEIAEQHGPNKLLRILKKRAHALQKQREAMLEEFWDN